jgi:hygromycin-B 4-O-kinase
MEYRKPDVGTGEILRLLEDLFESPVLDLAEVEGGQIAGTFRFKSAGSDYFISFNHPNMSQVLANELFFRERLAASGVPTRRIVGSGRHGGYSYFIAERAEGNPFHLLGADEQTRCLPSVFRVLDGISRVRVDDTSGFGWMDAACRGSFAAWDAHLLAVGDEGEGDFYGRWHDLFRDSFLEKDRFEGYYGEMEGLLGFVPETRRLVHGGFGYGNVLVRGGEVSAVIDWQDARYGDPVFDLAYMLFWRPEDLARAFLEEYRACAAERGGGEENLEERLRCYACYCGLDAMKFFAKQGSRSGYEGAVAATERLAGLARARP